MCTRRSTLQLTMRTLLPRSQPTTIHLTTDENWGTIACEMLPQATKVSCCSTPWRPDFRPETLPARPRTADELADQANGFKSLVLKHKPQHKKPAPEPPGCAESQRETAIKDVEKPGRCCFG